MNKFFFDIETTPAGSDQHGLLREILEGRQAKGKNTDDTFETYLAKTGLSGEFGHIVCLAYAINDEPVDVWWGEESDILTNFWRAAAGIQRFVGHNVLEFDLPFIMKRSRILGIKPSWSSRNLSFARYRNVPIYDTMREWDLWGNRQASLDLLARAFDLPTSKDAMDGSQVAGYYAAGRIEEICEYCKKDVELTRKVYRKMTYNDTF